MANITKKLFSSFCDVALKDIKPSKKFIVQMSSFITKGIAFGVMESKLFNEQLIQYLNSQPISEIDSNEINAEILENNRLTYYHRLISQGGQSFTEEILDLAIATMLVTVFNGVSYESLVSMLIMDLTSFTATKTSRELFWVLMSVTNMTDRTPSANLLRFIVLSIGRTMIRKDTEILLASRVLLSNIFDVENDVEEQFFPILIGKNIAEFRRRCKKCQKEGVVMVEELHNDTSLCGCSVFSVLEHNRSTYWAMELEIGKGMSLESSLTFVDRWSRDVLHYKKREHSVDDSMLLYTPGETLFLLM
jgi:hypothetical protein